MTRKAKAIITTADAEKRDLTVSKLGDEDKATCQMVATYGIEWLRVEKGWDADGVEAFMARPAIRREIQHLEQTFSTRDSSQAKLNFFRLNFINKFVPAALRTIVKVMQGDTVNDNNEVVRAPTRLQYEAATQILDRAHIQGAKMGNAMSASVLDSAAGVSSSIQDLSPERREVMRRVMGGVVRRGKAIVAAEEEHTQITTRRRTILTEVDAAGEPVDDNPDELVEPEA